MMAVAADLTLLRDRIRRIERPRALRHGVVSTGVATIDRALPGGGLALGAVHEILGAEADEEDGAAAAGFVAGIIARIVGGGLGTGIVLWCLKRADLYGPGLAAHGLEPGRLVVARARHDEDILWAVEEGLRATGIAAAIGEVGQLPMVASRRLQLAAERSGTVAFLLRRWRNAAEAAAERERPSAAVTRWRVASIPSLPEGDEPGLGRPCWRVELLRCRGGVPADWDVPALVGGADATDSLSLSAGLADRPVAPRRLVAAPERRRRAG